MLACNMYDPCMNRLSTAKRVQVVSALVEGVSINATCRVYKTLRVTPAMEAGLAHRVWTLEELVGLLGVTQAAAA